MFAARLRNALIKFADLAAHYTETAMALLRVDADGLWCEAGGFHIDPWNPVAKALVTHGHPDHARQGSGAYLCASPCELILRERFGQDAAIEGLPYGAAARVGDVSVSFHPAGHMLGSAQIRIEQAGEVWVVSGDYKLAADPTCAAFEPVRCHTFVTESTFGLPIFRWPNASEVVASIHEWWRANQAREKCSVLFANPWGKAQRVLAALDRQTGPIFCHEAVERVNRVYRAAGVELPECAEPSDISRALVIAPPSEHGSAWVKRFAPASTALASGWMRIRGTRRRRSIDRGFVFSDHADWPEIRTAIRESGAECVLVSHGYRTPLVRWLEEEGMRAGVLEAHFERGEEADE